MKYLLALGFLLISGCTTTVPVTRAFPDAPKTLMVPCEPLNTLSDTVTLSEFSSVVTNNYKKHHICSIIVDGWITKKTKKKPQA